LLGISLLAGCGRSSSSVSFEQLVSDAEKYDGKTVTLDAFYFSGFEISALSGSLQPASSGEWRIVPSQPLIWIEGGIPEETFNTLFKQTSTPSGYPEYYGKMNVTGIFETGGQYGHLGAYKYQIIVAEARLLEWTPPPSTTTNSGSGDLTIKIIAENDAPVAGVKVVSEVQPEGQLKVTGLTDFGGTVRFNNIKAGNYTFYVSAAGYAQHTVPVTVAADQLQSVTVNISTGQLTTAVVCYALAVFLDFPHISDLSKVPVSPVLVTGYVNNPRVQVTLTGLSVTVGTDGNFSSEVRLVEGNNKIEAIATLGRDHPLF